MVKYCKQVVAEDFGSKYKLVSVERTPKKKKKRKKQGEEERKARLSPL